MTSEESIDLKEVIFINQAAERDYEGMPPDIKESADEAITQIQNKRPLPAKMFKLLKGKLAGIHEIVLPYDSDTYRVYMVLFEAVVYVLDAGMKRSKSGKSIPPVQTERLIERRNRATQHYENHKGEFERAAAARKARHDYLVRIGELP